MGLFSMLTDCYNYKQTNAKEAANVSDYGELTLAINATFETSRYLNVRLV